MTPRTFLLPSARIARTADTAESTPPESPTTAFENPGFRISSRRNRTNSSSTIFILSFRASLFCADSMLLACLEFFQRLADDQETLIDLFRFEIQRRPEANSAVTAAYQNQSFLIRFAPQMITI